MRMVFPHFGRARGHATIEALYGAIVAQARRPAFYAAFGIADTAESRFELIVLHVALFFRRVRAEPGAIRELGQRVFDKFCSDMEHNLREMGVSDLAIPANMRRLGEAFYGRARAYDRALAADDEAGLTAALSRNVPSARPAGTRQLAAYVRAAAADLADQEASAFAQGVLRFAEPAALVGDTAAR